MPLCLGLTDSLLCAAFFELVRNTFIFPSKTTTGEGRLTRFPLPPPKIDMRTDIQPTDRGSLLPLQHDFSHRPHGLGGVWEQGNLPPGVFRLDILVEKAALTVAVSADQARPKATATHHCQGSKNRRLGATWSF